MTATFAKCTVIGSCRIAFSARAREDEGNDDEEEEREDDDDDDDDDDATGVNIKSFTISRSGSV